MARNEAMSRVNSITSSSAASTSTNASTDSGHSASTVKPRPSVNSKPTSKPLPATPLPPPAPPPTAPLPQLPSSTAASGDPSLRHTSSAGSRRGPPSRLKADEAKRHRSPAIKEDPQVSPTSAHHSATAAAATMPPSRDNRPDFGNYRRDLSAIDAATNNRSRSGSPSGPSESSYSQSYSNSHSSSGQRISIPPQIPQSSFGSPNLSQAAPWLISPTPPTPSGATGSASVYNESTTDHNSALSQLSLVHRTTSNPGPGSSSGPYSTSYPNNTSNNSGLSLRHTQTHNSADYSPDNVYFNDDRRPSVASIATTASSTGSRTSDRRQGGFRKLQGFFGEEFPGRDASDANHSSTTLSTSGREHKERKDSKDSRGKDRSHSYSHGRPYRDRNYSNATDRDTSPTSSRPRTPVPAPKEVVPFLYQEADDIARYGEAPVRDTLSGPDRERYVNDTSSQHPPKTSSSARSGHSIAHLPHHRHNRSNDDHRLGRQVISREDSLVSMRERAAAPPSLYNAALSRAHSPTPSGNSGGNSSQKSAYADAQASPPPGVPKKGIFGRFIRSSTKDKDDGQSSSNNGHGHGFAAQLKKVPQVAHSLTARPSRVELPRAESNAAPHMWANETTLSLPQRLPSDADYPPPPASRHGSTTGRHATFNNKFPFSKKSRTQRNMNENDEMIGPTDRADPGTRFYLDTDLNNMDGIVRSHLPLPPMDADAHRRSDNDRPSITTAAASIAGAVAASAAGSTAGSSRVNHYFQKQPASAGGGTSTPGATAPVIQGSVTSGRNGSGSARGGVSGSPGGPLVASNGSVSSATPTGLNGAWNAPDSWGVRRVPDDASNRPQAEERTNAKQPPFCIRVFKSDRTFATVSLPLNCTVHDVIQQIAKRVFGDGQDYLLVLQRQGVVRVLGPTEQPMIIQKRILEQIGYEKKDHLEDLGREDNSYFCRFLFLTAHENDAFSRNDLGSSRLTKLNHVDLSGRNLITIPISLYPKAAEITSLNLSRNLSLDIPRDFIQSCHNLRDIKYSNNEASKIPPSLGRASRLTYLDISNNSIETMELAELEDITGVLKLNLANNRLMQLPSYFSTYHALRSLNISSNFLDKFPDFLCELGSLIDLDLSFNLISSLPDSIGNLRNLEKFVITNNRLTGPFPRGFQDLESLRELDIKYNSIDSIDVISALPKLEILSADHNSISQFCGSFERLRTLKLNANPITRFEIVSPLPTLKLLNLSNAQLASFDESFTNVRGLERLYLDSNYFVSLPNQIGNLGRLETFSIANNSIGELPPEIGCLKELKTLDVRGNNLRKLPMEIWWANKLETLNASSNVLDNFPKPASRPPQVPGESTSLDAMSAATSSRLNSTVGTLSPTPSSEELSVDGSRRPSHASSTLLAVAASPVPSGSDRKSSIVSVYGKGGRKTSVVSRSPAQTSGMATPTPSVRKDSGLSARITNTFAGSLRNLFVADNQLDDEVFDQLVLLGELRVLNMSYNDLTDVPQRSMKSWPQLVELYLSGNELTTLPADDLGEYSMLQTLHINNNKFTNLPADISRAKKLTVLDCGNNSLKYNISNVPYDWNWNLNPNLRYLNLSGNRRLEITQSAYHAGMRPVEQLADFSRLVKLRVLGLMDVTLIQPSVPDQSEDRRVRTLGSVAGFLPYGMADTLGKNEHLSTMDLVVPKFASANDDPDLLIGLFDGQALSSGGSKIAKFLHENFSSSFAAELKVLKTKTGEVIEDALRRAFLSLNKDLVSSSAQGDDRALPAAASLTTMVSATSNQHRGSVAPMVMSREDLNSGGVATVAYLVGHELYVANVGDAQAMLIQNEGSHKMLTRKHDPAEPRERSRIRDAGGWVSRNGRLNEVLDVSRAFGYSDLMPSVMAAPHIMHHTVRDQDETVIIATKELWEYLKPGLVVDVARQERGDLMRAAQKLRDLAMAYGASGKIMVMMLSVSDLRRKMERSRLHRGQSMSVYGNMTDELAQQFAPARRGKRVKGEVQDSNLQRLAAEVPAPTGLIAIVFTDIKSSTNLWETYPAAMRSAIKLHNELMRRQLRNIGGFEVKTEGDAFMVSFPTATSALQWALTVQLTLLEADWPAEMLNSVSCQPIYDEGDSLIFRGLSVRMGIHWGEPLCEPDPITRRMDYYGPMVNKAARINSVADGGQITVSSDFISEIKRCLESYQETPQGSTAGLSSDGGMAGDAAAGGGVGGSSISGASSTTGTLATFDDDPLASTIRRELKLLSDQGFIVTEMGEIKLKGLENPETVYSIYPTVLAGRKAAHLQHERMTAAMAAAATAGMDGQLQIANGGGSVAGGSAGSAAGSMGAMPTDPAGHIMGGPMVRSLSLASCEDGAGGGAFTLGAGPDSDDLRVIPETIWGLWRISLRLEMLCSTLEEVGGTGLQPPETELMERMKQRGANVTETFLMNFLTHQISRIETCINTLAVRHMAFQAVMAEQRAAEAETESEVEIEDTREMIHDLDDLRGPMTDVFAVFAAQLAELQAYRSMYGPLSGHERVEEYEEEDDEDDEGSDTEQE